MANEKRMIDANELKSKLQGHKDFFVDVCGGFDEMSFATKCRVDEIDSCIAEIVNAPTVDAYTAHEVAEIIADLFGDTCACNFNRIDEWLPEKCELLDACPDTVGVACWEQYLKYRSAKMDGDGNG